MSDSAKPNALDLKKQLTPEQFEVTQACGTEPAFRNAYWNNHKPGLYVDVVSGEPLFSSREKFDSGTGWPSFTRPVFPEAVDEKTDASQGLSRTEVRSRVGDSHLGHVFADGPKPTGERYCINSAALRFIPEADLEKEGYPGYSWLFHAAPVQTVGLAGGCFWGTEAYLKQVPGVVRTRVGYQGGFAAKPTYEQVYSGKTGHAETVLVDYDPKVISLDTLLRHFFRIHDPSSLNRQGNDRGTQYRSAIFYYHPDQKTVIAARIASVHAKLAKEVVTEVRPAPVFYDAEPYHQDYLGKNPGGYCHINLGLIKQPLAD